MGAGTSGDRQDYEDIKIPRWKFRHCLTNITNIQSHVKLVPAQARVL
jgi:hypothetical protein